MHAEFGDVSDFPCGITRIKEVERKKYIYRNQESLKFLFKCSVSAPTVVALSLSSLLNDLTFSVGGYSLEPFQTVFCYYFNSQEAVGNCYQIASWINSSLIAH